MPTLQLIANEDMHDDFEYNFDVFDWGKDELAIQISAIDNENEKEHRFILNKNDVLYLKDFLISITNNHLFNTNN